MLANGIGPIENSILPREELVLIMARAIDIFDIISVRDKDSQRFMQKLLPKRKIRYVCDPALGYFIQPPSKINRKLISKDKKTTITETISLT